VAVLKHGSVSGRFDQLRATCSPQTAQSATSLRASDSHSQPILIVKKRVKATAVASRQDEGKSPLSTEVRPSDRIASQLTENTQMSPNVSQATPLR
jgi:hypothetical protein